MKLRRYALSISYTPNYLTGTLLPCARRFSLLTRLRSSRPPFRNLISHRLSSHPSCFSALAQKCDWFRRSGLPPPPKQRSVMRESIIIYYFFFFFLKFLILLNWIYQAQNNLRVEQANIIFNQQKTTYSWYHSGWYFSF